MQTPLRANHRHCPYRSGEVEAPFAAPRVVDLYSDVVAPSTEWPLPSYGLKAIAKSRGLRWNAADAWGCEQHRVR